MRTLGASPVRITHVELGVRESHARRLFAGHATGAATSLDTTLRTAESTSLRQPGAAP